MDTHTFNILSLCTGGGGLDLGVSLAVPTARIVCCVEYEAYCCEVLAARMEAKDLDDAPVWTDLRTFDGCPWRGVVDCITAGYPCQPFSCAGKRSGEDDPRHLWPQIHRIVGEVEPELCFFENVPGHLTLGFDSVLTCLREMGYAVAAGLFSALEVGVPELGVRLFAMGIMGKTSKDRSGWQGKTWESPWASQADTRIRQRFIWPPGPRDTRSWAHLRYLAPNRLPTISNRVSGVVNGSPDWVDRYSLLGNSANPLQAAYVFVSLWSALCEG